ncbi:MAG: alpha/beta hydrolase, partial [Tepidisphaeraceae bacterium]
MTYAALAMALLASVAMAQMSTAAPTTKPAGEHTAEHAGEPHRINGAIHLGPDDVSQFPDPPYGFNIVREGIPHGRLQRIDYASKTVGTTRHLQVYTPPGYSKDQKYPVLYLMHGIGGDENEWERYAHVDTLLDNLIADKQAVPMIVVMPNGRARKNDRAEGDLFAAAPAFQAFEGDLLNDVIPTIDARYSTLTDKDHRALAGLSMGGGQTLNFGLAHPDTFGWLGSFSAAPNTKPPAELITDPQACRSFDLIWLSCGSQDGLIRISQGVHQALKAQNIPHVWHVARHGHDPAEWSQALYYFAQKLF